MKIALFFLLLIGISCNHKVKENIMDAKSVVSNMDIRLLDSIQKQCFDYYWLGSDTESTAARERIHMDQVYEWGDSSIVTSGGTGFGIMATLVGIKRNFITRSQGYQRLNHLVYIYFDLFRYIQFYYF